MSTDIPATTVEPEIKKITVVLTGRAPVKIVKGDWPTIANASWHDIANASWHDGELACQANEKIYLRVRQHKDGRTLVYGVRDSGPGGRFINYCGAAGGELIPADQITSREDERSLIPAAIKDVGHLIGASDDLIAECIAALPPEEI